MKFRNLWKWDNTNESKELIYFSQLLMEMLFDFSLDTYKPSALNTSLLCYEALNVIDDIKKEIVRKPNLDHILEEFSDSLKRDKVSSSILTLNIKKALAILQNKTKPIEEKKIILELILSQIKISIYRKKNEDLLIECVTNSASFNDIRSLARSYITTLKGFNFSSKWIEERTIDFFYTGENRITGNEAISDFINLFSIENQEYVAIYRASNIFSTIADSCEKLSMTVSQEVETYDAIVTAAEFSLEGDDTYVIVKDIEAKEIYSARAESDNRIELMQTFLTLFHHKEHPTWLSDCLVINKESESFKVLQKPINPMHKCIDLRPQKASKRLNNFISEFSMDEISFPKFIRSSELHSLALSSDSLENQMINLWIALESLVPTASEDKNTINNIIDSCLPFLTLNYVNRLLDRLNGDILNWNSYELNRALRGIAGKSFRSKLVKLLILDEYSGRRDRLNREFRDFHLLKSRFKYIQSVVTSPKSILKTLNSHEMRVSWQLRRIYRTRNIIVHSGRTPSSTGTLIENIHDYLDLIMSTLTLLASQKKIIQTVEQGFKYIEMNAGAHVDILKDMDEQQYKSKIDDVLFKYGI